MWPFSAPKKKILHIVLVLLKWNLFNYPSTFIFLMSFVGMFKNNIKSLLQNIDFFNIWWIKYEFLNAENLRPNNI